MYVDFTELRPVCEKSMLAYITGARPYVCDLPELKAKGIFIKGTDSPDDALDDAEAYKSLIPFLGATGVDIGARAHDGFLDAASGIALQISNQIKFNERIVLGGHSSGGAIASLVAFELAMSGYRDISVYTFGSPRVFNKAAASAYTALIPATYRIVHGYDIVPFVPWWCYHHVGELIRIGSTGCEFPKRYGLSCIAGYFVDRFRRTIKDHSTEQYLSAVSAYCNNNK
jgi:hypothetical protein